MGPGTQKSPVQTGLWPATAGRRVLLGVYPDGPQPQLVTRGLWGAATRCSTSTVKARAVRLCGDAGWGGDRSRFDAGMAWYGMARFRSLISMLVLLVLESYNSIIILIFLSVNIV